MKSKYLQLIFRLRSGSCNLFNKNVPHLCGIVAQWHSSFRIIRSQFSIYRKRQTYCYKLNRIILDLNREFDLFYLRYKSNSHLFISLPTIVPLPRRKIPNDHWVLIFEDSWLYSDPPNSVDCCGREIRPTQKPLLDNSQQSKEKNNNVTGWIRTHNLIKPMTPSPTL
jgi:hypothetical protein